MGGGRGGGGVSWVTDLSGLKGEGSKYHLPEG